MKLQLTLVLLGLTYVLSAPTDPSSAEPNDSESSSEHSLEEKDFWMKIKEGLEEAKTKGLEINTLIQEKYNDFQDLDKYITGADDASKEYFNNKLVKQFDEIKEKTIPCQEALETAQQFVNEKIISEKSYSEELYSIDFELYHALDYLVRPYDLFMSAVKLAMEDAFNLEDEQKKKEEIKQVVKSTKKYFNPSDYRPYSYFIGTIDEILEDINEVIKKENE